MPPRAQADINRLNGTLLDLQGRLNLHGQIVRQPRLFLREPGLLAVYEPLHAALELPRRIDEAGAAVISSLPVRASKGCRR